MPDRYEQILERLQPLRKRLLAHPIYAKMKSFESLHLFMQHHVFAVWDFMSLLKALQQQLCCVDVPWIPNSDGSAARFVNEIVLAEETDVLKNGTYTSHFDLYRSAMIESNADVSQIDQFISCLREKSGVASALKSAHVTDSVATFVLSTFETIDSKDLPAIAASFTFGREDLLPEVFEKLVSQLHENDSTRLDQFKYYLDRHIELDGDEHGPLARRMMESICKDDESSWQRAEHAAMQALSARAVMWDGMLEELLKNIA